MINNINDLSDSEIELKISELGKKRSVCGNTDVAAQINDYITQLWNELIRRKSESLKDEETDLSFTSLDTETRGWN